MTPINSLKRYTGVNLQYSFFTISPIEKMNVDFLNVVPTTKQRLLYAMDIQNFMQAAGNISSVKQY